MYRLYVLTAMAGKENKARRDLLQRAESLGLSNKLRRVEIPSDKVVEVKDGVRKEKEIRTLPGYILAELELNAETWELVRGTPNLNFTNAFDQKEPVPLLAAEVDKMLGASGQTTQTNVTAYEKGQDVKIISGPMSDWAGVVTEVDDRGRRLKILVTIFGRETSVDVAYEQVSKP